MPGDFVSRVAPLFFILFIYSPPQARVCRAMASAQKRLVLHWQAAPNHAGLVGENTQQGRGIPIC